MVAAGFVGQLKSIRGQLTVTQALIEMPLSIFSVSPTGH